LLQSCDNFLEPSLEDLILQLKAAQEEIREDLIGHLLHHLKQLASPDDLVNLFTGLRGKPFFCSFLAGNAKLLCAFDVLTSIFFRSVA